MWESQIDGRRLTFHLTGINNQNFIMTDEETGSWWQQVSGEAIHGPMKGRRLTQVYNDEISYAVWKTENPHGRVLRPDERVRDKYESADWEERYAKFRVVTPIDPADKLAPRALVAGVTIGKSSVAYPFAALETQRLILDEPGGVPIFLVLAEDGKSLRAFERRVDGRKLEFFLEAHASPLRMTDAETASVWDFSGKAISGPLAGKQLKKIAALRDYWFDWKIYHPGTAIYAPGVR